MRPAAPATIKTRVAVTFIAWRAPARRPTRSWVSTVGSTSPSPPSLGNTTYKRHAHAWWASRNAVMAGSTLVQSPCMKTASACRSEARNASRPQHCLLVGLAGHAPVGGHVDEHHAACRRAAPPARSRRIRHDVPSSPRRHRAPASARQALQPAPAAASDASSSQQRQRSGAAARPAGAGARYHHSASASSTSAGQRQADARRRRAACPAPTAARPRSGTSGRRGHCFSVSIHAPGLGRRCGQRRHETDQQERQRQAQAQHRNTSSADRRGRGEGEGQRRAHERRGAADWRSPPPARR